MGEAQQPRKTPKVEHAAELEQQHHRLAAKIDAQTIRNTQTTGNTQTIANTQEICAEAMGRGHG